LRSLRFELVKTHLFVILAPLLLATVLLLRSVPVWYTNTLAEHLQLQVYLLRDLVQSRLERPDPHETLAALARRVGQALSFRVTIIARDGRVRGDSEADLTTMPNHATRPEVVQAWEHGVGRAERYSDTLRETMLYIATPVQRGGKPWGTVRGAVSFASVENGVRRVQHTLAIVLLGAGVLAVLLAVRAATAIADPIRELSQHAERVSEGDLARRVHPTGAIEIRRLGHSFNRMTRRLRSLLQTMAADRSKLETILTQMADGILVTDAGGLLTLVNPPAEALLGLETATMLGRSLVEATLNHRLWALLQESLREGSARAEEVRLLFPFPRIVRAYAAPVFGEQGELEGGVLVLQDLTEARRVDEMRREFVGNVSHELKTPVAAIRAMAETIALRGLKHPDLAQDYSERIVAESVRLGRLVEDLLALAAIESGRREPRRTPISAARLVAEVLERSGAAAAQKAIRLESDVAPDLIVVGDEDLLSQVVGNLVDNGLKYTPEGGRVCVTAVPGEQGVTFTVADTGPGITPADQARIFERFYRVDKARSRETEGTGLGLAIVKHIVEVHGGRVWVESEPGRGSTFGFTIPLQTQEAFAS
jgi:two-component system phosphate regulon sensor histidine kinase PhoR